MQEKAAVSAEAFAPKLRFEVSCRCSEGLQALLDSCQLGGVQGPLLPMVHLPLGMEGFLVAVENGPSFRASRVDNTWGLRHQPGIPRLFRGWPPLRRGWSRLFREWSQPFSGTTRRNALRRVGNPWAPDTQMDYSDFKNSTRSFFCWPLKLSAK